MPLDPRIPLGAVANQTPNLVGSYAQGQQLRALAQQEELRDFQLEQARQQVAEQTQLKDIFASHTAAGTVGSESYLRDVGQVSPGFYQAEQAAQAKRAQAAVSLQTALINNQKATLQVQSARLQQADELNDYMVEKLSACIDAAGTEGAQACYERAKADVANTFQAIGLDTSAVDALPEIFDPRLVNDMRMQSLSVKDQLAEARQGIDFKVREAEAMLPVKEREAQQKAEATEASRIRVQKAGTARLAAAQEHRARQEARQVTIQERGIENTLRDEFRQLTAEFRSVRDAYGRIQASLSDPSAAGDLSLIFSYMKLLDPTSVVREGEQATAANAGSIPERIRGQYNRALRGEKFTETIRRDFAQRANKLYAQYVSDYTKTREQYSDLATRSGVNPENVVLDFETTAPVTPPPVKRMTEQDIQDAMSQTGWTREQVLDAARRKGYEVP